MASMMVMMMMQRFYNDNANDDDAHLSEHTRLAQLLKAGRCVAENSQGGRLSFFSISQVVITFLFPHIVDL